MPPYQSGYEAVASPTQFTEQSYGIGSGNFQPMTEADRQKMV
jgi:hypothetical protein